MNITHNILPYTTKYNIRSIIVENSSLDSKDIVLHYSKELEIPMLLTIGRWKVKHKPLELGVDYGAGESKNVKQIVGVIGGMPKPGKTLFTGLLDHPDIIVVTGMGKELPKNLDIPIIPLKLRQHQLIGPKHQITRENYIEYLKSNIKKR